MFSDRLKEARKNAGLSQEKLGLLMGLKKQTISDYERGYSEPDMAKVAMFMSILGVDANFLWQDEMNLKEEPAVSSEALAVARAYDQLSAYGKSMIDTILQNEKKYVIKERVPVIIAAHDSDTYARYNARKEQKELIEEENSENTER